MDWFDLIKYVIDKLPAGMLGIIVTIGILFYLNKSKKSPLNISWGNNSPINGKSVVTFDAMRENCEKRQTNLNVNLQNIDGKLDRIIGKQGEHGERLANLEGRFYHSRLEDKHAQHR